MLANIFFVVSAGLLIYTYLGYPLLLILWGLLRPRPHDRDLDYIPMVSLIIAAWNEEQVIREKIENSLALDYPQDRLEIVVACDGCTDETAMIAREYSQVHVIEYPKRRGKTAVLNETVPRVKGEIVVFSDANAFLQPGALEQLAANFVDPEVGCVDGVKRITHEGVGTEGLYWLYESLLKKYESRIGSIVGADGGLFAIRRALYVPPPEDTLIDDFVLSIRVVLEGRRAIYEPKAVASEEAAPSLGGEYRRKVRMAAGAFQTMARMPSLILNPLRGRIWWQTCSHKVLRWLGPFWLIGAAVGAVFATGWLRTWGLGLQLVFYLAALLGGIQAVFTRIGWPPLRAVFYFCFTNCCLLVGFFRWVLGKQKATWEKAERRRS